MPRDEYHSLPNSTKRPSHLVRQYRLKTKYRKRINKDRPIKMNNCWLYTVKHENGDNISGSSRP